MLVNATPSTSPIEGTEAAERAPGPLLLFAMKMIIYMLTNTQTSPRAIRLLEASWQDQSALEASLLFFFWQCEYVVLWKTEYLQ